MATVGTGEYTYEVVENWGRLPAGWTFGMVTGVAVDSRDRVYVVQRKADGPEATMAPDLIGHRSRPNTPSVVVFDLEGNYLGSWDHGAISYPHNISIDANDFIYISERDLHTALKFTLEGELLLELGTRGVYSDTGCDWWAGEVLRPGGPFNMPGKFVSSPTGDLYVADGDRNCRVHRFSAEGTLISSWGTPGSGPLQFRVPHSIWIDRQGVLYVCDRDNHRIQLLSPDGEFIGQWTGFDQPTDICMDAAEQTVYITGQGDNHRVSVLNREGKFLACWAPPASNHGIWGDSRGGLYIAEELRKGVTKYVRL